MDICRKGGDQKCLRMEEEEASVGIDTALTIYGKPLMAVYSFQYLGRIILASEYDWPEVIYNLRKARNNWAHLSIVLGL